LSHPYDFSKRFFVHPVPQLKLKVVSFNVHAHISCYTTSFCCFRALAYTSVGMMCCCVWCSAADNIVKADEIRMLVKDIWDMRMAKLRSSINVFLKSDATHAKVPVTVM